MKKTTTIVLLLCLLFTLPAWASTSDEVRTFGYTDERNRDTKVNGGAFLAAYYHDGGASFSQPLILKGDRWGLVGKMVAVTVEGNCLNGYILPDKLIEMPQKAQPIEPIWSVTLSGDKPTLSHPTFREDEGKKFIYIGTYSNYLDIIDITDFQNVNQSNLTPVYSEQATDITSAPLILNWNGHEIVLATSGNTGKVFILTDSLNANINNFYINVGSGRTSSSPAPVAGGQGFAIGLDKGPSKGEMQIYYLDDILTENANGKVVQKSGTARVIKKLPSGLCASFSVDGNMLYFGDSQSHVYGYNTDTNTYTWGNNNNAGIFSNRSPGLTSTRVYFPATGELNSQGKLLSIDRDTGKTVWAIPMSYKDKSLGRAMTAPSIIRAPKAPYILEGTSTGHMLLINPIDGKAAQVIDSAKYMQSQGLSSYASGVSGEISALGDYAVTTTESGVVIWALMDINFTAVSIDPGIPQGTKPKPDTELTGKVIFRNESVFLYENIPVAVLHNGYSATLIDENGLELPKMNVDGKQVQVANFEPGKERIFTFKYHPPNIAVTHLAGYINHDKIGIAVINEPNFEDNVVTTDITLDVDNLWVEILEYPTSVQTSTNTTVKARIHNDRGELLTTRLVWKINGNIVKDVQNYDIIGTLDAGVSFTMPSSGASVSVEVNPDKDRPDNEISYNDNIATCYISAVPIPNIESDGSSKLSIDISAPSTVEAFKSWKYTVTVNTYFKKPKLSDDPPPTIIMNVNATGQSADTSIDYNYETGYQKIITVTKTAKETFSAGWGSNTHTYTYTHPGTGIWGQPTAVIIKATATGGSENATATATVKVNPLSIPGVEIQLYQ